MVSTRKDGDFHGRAVSFREGSALLWRSLNAAPVFHMKNDPVSGVLKANLFVRLLHLKDCTGAEIGLCASSACKVLL